jgi:hypothetical protein
MKSLFLPVALYAFATPVIAHETTVEKTTSEYTQITIENISSDKLVEQFWNPAPSYVEAIVLKRRQRARK